MEQYYAEIIGYMCDAAARTCDEFIWCMASLITLEFAMCGTLVEVEP